MPSGFGHKMRTRGVLKGAHGVEMNWVGRNNSIIFPCVFCGDWWMGRACIVSQRDKMSLHANSRIAHNFIEGAIFCVL